MRDFYINVRHCLSLEALQLLTIAKHFFCKEYCNVDDHYFHSSLLRTAKASSLNLFALLTIFFHQIQQYKRDIFTNECAMKFSIFEEFSYCQNYSVKLDTSVCHCPLPGWLSFFRILTTFSLKLLSIANALWREFWHLKALFKSLCVIKRKKHLPSLLIELTN